MIDKYSFKTRVEEMLDLHIAGQDAWVLSDPRVKKAEAALKEAVAQSKKDLADTYSGFKYMDRLEKQLQAENYMRSDTRKKYHGQPVLAELPDRPDRLCATHKLDEPLAYLQVDQKVCDRFIWDIERQFEVTEVGSDIQETMVTGRLSRQMSTKVAKTFRNHMRRMRVPVRQEVVENIVFWSYGSFKITPKEEQFLEDWMTISALENYCGLSLLGRANGVSWGCLWQSGTDKQFAQKFPAFDT